MNDVQNSSIFEKKFTPLYQAGVILGVILIILIVAKVINLIKPNVVDDQFPWMISSAFMLFFALLNSVFALTTQNLPRYWNRSIPIFFGTLFISGLMAYLFSGIWVEEAGSYRWILIVVSIGYLVFLSLMTFARRIVDFAMKEEWNQPRVRKRKK